MTNYNPNYNEMLYRTVKGDFLIIEGYPTQIVVENHRRNNYFLTASKEKIPYGEVDEVQGCHSDTGEIYTKFLRYRTFHK